MGENNQKFFVLFTVSWLWYYYGLDVFECYIHVVIKTELWKKQEEKQLMSLALHKASLMYKRNSETKSFDRFVELFMN